MAKYCQIVQPSGHDWNAPSHGLDWNDIFKNREDWEIKNHFIAIRNYKNKCLCTWALLSRRKITII